MITTPMKFAAISRESSRERSCGCFLAGKDCCIERLYFTVFYFL